MTVNYILALAFGVILQIIIFAGPEHIWPDAGNTWYTVIFRIFFFLAYVIVVNFFLYADRGGKKHKYEA